jgi:pimeloyl-ACP methyl ester carboxylesterase/acyl carrier protein
VDRKALPAPDQTRPELQSQFEPPRTSLELLIAEVWREVLGVDRVGVYDNFFDLGGHSLLSVQAMAKLEQKTGLKVPLALVGYQTLGQLAATYEAQMRLSQQPAAPGSTQLGSNGKEPATSPITSLPELAMVEPKTSSGADLEPFYFGVSNKHLFGCYHAPQSGPARDCAVALCYPMGAEYIRSHRAYHQLATHLARAGFPVLRFDFLGCGDSAGEAEEGGLSQWLSDIATAIGEVKERSGLQQICLIGLRLGASLALLSGAEREDVTGVVLWEPIINGKAYLAELAAQHQEALWHFPVQLKYCEIAEQPKELMGFPLTAAMLADFEKLDCLTIRQRPAKRALIVEGQEEGMAESLEAHLHSSDTQVTYRYVPSFKIWTENPDKGLVPHQTLQVIVSWISKVYP